MSDSTKVRHATRIAPLVAGDRTRFARELRGLTQTELVARTTRALSSAALSQLELGRSRPPPATLLAVADVVDCPLDFFVARPGDRPPAGFFRSLRSTTAPDRRRQLARARLMHE